MGDGEQLCMQELKVGYGGGISFLGFILSICTVQCYQIFSARRDKIDSVGISMIKVLYTKISTICRE